MIKQVFHELRVYQRMTGAIGYGPHKQQVTFYRLFFGKHLFVYGKGLYHYRSVHLPAHVSADLLKESNNKK